MLGQRGHWAGRGQGRRAGVGRCCCHNAEWADMGVPGMGVVGVLAWDEDGDEEVFRVSVAEFHRMSLLTEWVGPGHALSLGHQHPHPHPTSLLLPSPSPLPTPITIVMGRGECHKINCHFSE
jgi:hypothetical protein